MLRTKIFLWLAKEIACELEKINHSLFSTLFWLRGRRNDIQNEINLVEDAIRLHQRELDNRNKYLTELGYKLNIVNNEIQMKELEVVEEKQ